VSASASALVRLPVWRARFVLAGLVAAFVVTAGRSLYLQAMDTDFLQEKGEARYSRVLEVPGTRRRVLDRNGGGLAISTPVQAGWAIPGGVQASGAIRYLNIVDTDLPAHSAACVRDVVSQTRLGDGAQVSWRHRVTF